MFQVALEHTGGTWQCLKRIRNASRGSAMALGSSGGALPPSNGSRQHWEVRLGVF